MPSQNLENLKKEIGEVRLLLDGLSAYQEIPAPIIELAIAKADHLKQLLLELKNEFEDPTEQGIEKVMEEAPMERIITPPPIVNEVVELVDNPTFETEELPVQEDETMMEEIAPSATFEPEKNEIPTLTKEEEKEEAVEPVEEKQVEMERTDSIKSETPPAQNNTQTSKTVLGDTIGTHKKVMNDIIGGSQNHTLGKRIEESAINDLKRAIPINDRFRFQRELFENNVSLFNETLTHLNTMPNFDEARSYLVDAFEWDEESDSARDFFVLLGRRFVK